MYRKYTLSYRNPHYSNLHYDKVYVVTYGTYLIQECKECRIKL